ncbi:MAG: PAS domain S-box protein, partial [Calditrichaeota bacterium]|nr:PAS domain S-box protein [Calditrichota bacterium]
MKHPQTHSKNPKVLISATLEPSVGSVAAPCSTADETQRLAAFLETSHELAGKLELQELLQALASRAKDLVASDGVTLYLVEGELLKPIVCLDSYAEEIMSTPLALGQGISGGVAASGEADMANRVDLTGRGFLIPGTPLEPESLLCAPLKYEDEVIGVLTLNRLGEWEFEPPDLEFVKGLADLGATAIHNARLYARLSQSEQSYRSLFNHIGEAVSVHDPNTWRFADVNDTTVRRYGYTRDELLRMTILDLHPPEERDAVAKRVEVGIEQSPAHYDGVHHRKKDGTVIEVNISAVDIEFDGRPARLVLAVDITEQQ